MIIEGFTDELFYYFLKVAFEDVTLTGHVYRLLDFFISESADSAQLIGALRRKQSKIDTEYPDTILQIWHYYVLFRHSNDADRANMIASLKEKHFNPLLATIMVLPGKEKNRELFNAICAAYTREAGSGEWKQEIMNSRWWLPLFKIARYDSMNYSRFMKSENFPEILKIFPMHIE